MYCKKTIILVIMLIMLTTSVYSIITREDAEDLILNQILVEEIENINVFLSYNTVGVEGIQLWDKQLTSQYSSSWVCFVDDMPCANWSHSCRYIFIDSNNGAYQIFTECTPPVLSDFENIHNIVLPDPIELPVDPNANIEGREQNSHYYAVIINGGFKPDFNYIRYWNDISAIYCTLTQVYGYMPNNIFTFSTDGSATNNHGSLDLDNDDNDDIEYPANKSSINEKFSLLAQTLNSDDQLFIFVTDHGYRIDDISYILLWDHNGNGTLGFNEMISSEELHDMLLPIEAAEIIVVMEQCTSGGFITDPVNITGPHRVIHTATDGDNPSYAEMWITGEQYDEFVYYWTAAARGYYPSTYEPWSVTVPAGQLQFTELGIPAFSNHPPDYDPDLDGDGFVSMREAFLYADNWDTCSGEGQHNNYFNPYSNQVEYPDSLHNIGFDDDILTLSGITGYITNNNQFVEGNYLLGNYGIVLPNGFELTFSDDSNFFLSDSSRIVVNETATLNIGNDVTIKGSQETIVNIQVGNQVEVYGNLIINTNCSFSAASGDYWDGLFCYDGNSLILDASCFTNCNLYCDSRDITISDVNFLNSSIECIDSDISIENSNFDNAPLTAYILGETVDKEISITDNCVFQKIEDNVAIEITAYPNFTIGDIMIEDCVNGIIIYESGSGSTHVISNNVIQKCTERAIFLYHTYADITGANDICLNNTGLSVMRNSNFSCIGNQTPEYQQIKYNIENEVTFSYDSSPIDFSYNKIYDSNHNNYYVMCFSIPANPTEINISNNYWGDDFNPSTDLYPEEIFSYNPIWGREGDEAQLLFELAKQYEINNDYLLAEQSYKQVISDYPTSPYILISAKELFALEEKIGLAGLGQDFSELKSYYETEPNMQYNAEMTKLSDYLINYCDIKLQNYPDAISWFESVILNPPSLIDSVCAVIDAGYTYLLMENSGRSNYLGQMTELKPNSREEFETIRDELLSEFLRNYEGNENQNDIITTANLNGNYPNPFNPATTISFSVPDESKVELIVYNIKGQKVKTLVNNDLVKGNHSVVWNGIDESGKSVSSGVYFYKIAVNDKSKSVKKCLMLK